MTKQQNEQNPLLDQQLKEAAQVRLFLDSPAWTWLRARLEAQRPILMAKATAPGIKRDDRMLLMGKLAQVVEILERPGMLTELEARWHAENEKPQIPQEPTLPTQRYTPGIV